MSRDVEWKWKLIQEEIVIINNTTDVPMTLVRIAISRALALLPDKGAGIEIENVTIKNKAEGKVHGRWGWYFPSQKRIVIIVPRVISAPYITKLRHAYQKLTIKSRVEFLVMVMAHEMRHAYQFQVSHYMTGHTRSEKWYAERDAELFQSLALMEWLDFINTQTKEA